MSGTRTVYLDSSAIVKLISKEKESEALFEFLADYPGRVASRLARTETVRTLRRLDYEQSAVAKRTEEVFANIRLVEISNEIADLAAVIGPPTLRALDALHVATAQSLGDELSGIVTYDGRMAAAAKEIGLTPFAPAPTPDPR